jgi:ribokinase
LDGPVDPEAPLRPRVIVAGSINMDLVAAVARLPEPGETTRGAALSFHPGGKGANQAVAAALAGAPVALLGCLGEDPYAGQLESFLAARGIDLAGVRRRPGAVTGIALVLVDARGENTIVSIPGANALLDAASATAVAARAGDILLAQFETPLATTAAFFAAGRAAGAITVLNAAPATGPGDLLGLTDVLVVNEGELAACLGDPAAASPAGATPAGIVERARRLQRRGVRAVVVTLGRRGAVAVDGPALFELDGYPVVAADATGAGDCFTGNLAARLAAGDPFGDALRYANASASICVERPGAGSSMPEAAQVRARLGLASSPPPGERTGARSAPADRWGESDRRGPGTA